MVPKSALEMIHSMADFGTTTLERFHIRVGSRNPPSFLFESVIYRPGDSTCADHAQEQPLADSAGQECLRRFFASN